MQQEKTARKYIVDIRVGKSVYMCLCYFHKIFKRHEKLHQKLAALLNRTAALRRVFSPLYLLKLEACEYSPCSQTRANPLLIKSVPGTKARNGRGGPWGMLNGGMLSEDRSFRV